ncbi:hypothetical protein V5P93_007061 [Actinokineospora auranticolor]|uniref:Excreted virulence factor EspC (Type VII ESX diderm) n=1 Tax=Actinokineospora auranticolor TaxID=155976 RepID=A0A2S6GH09_9PSEU|nr:hypothetical protein [Actinokineospora auranticolor]PPK64489.1 excreted virulence factor EspC (type VII ESX diderm) [Actinokineospora auranticolor]
MTRVRTMQQVEQLAKSRQVQDRAYVDSDVRADPQGDFRLTGTGMDGMEVDYAALSQAYSQLGDLHAELAKQRDLAAELEQPMGDGSGPVAARMAQAFGVRADAEGGVRAVLEKYLTELADVRESIRATLADYETVDNAAKDALNRAGRI